MPLTPPQLRARKGGEKIVALTAYTYRAAQLLDAHADLLLVGDSLGMTIYGLPGTVGVSVEMMIPHGAAVARGAGHALVAIDLPFGSYEQSPAQAFATCARIMKETGCAAVKLEGGAEMAETIRFLSARGVPVIGHVGLLPQHASALGGFKIQGRDDKAHARIVADARAVEEAGAFCLVVEGVTEPLAREITQAASIPVIGIGASPACDGQILVIDDVIGLTEKPPRFAKAYADAAASIEQAAKAYAQEVKSGAFPDAAHCFGAKN